MKNMISVLIFMFLPSFAWAANQGVIVKDGKVINIVILPKGWTGKTGEWQPPEGSTVVTGKGGEIGDYYDGSKFIKFVFVNRDPQTNEITRVSKHRMGPTQTRIPMNHADVEAYRTKQDEKISEASLIEAKKEARAKRLAKEELEREGFVFKHH